MQKYQEDFARLRNSSVSQGLRNSFLACENFARGCEIHSWEIHKLANISQEVAKFTNVNSFSDSLPCILDWFGKGFQALPNLDSSCNLASILLFHQPYQVLPRSWLVLMIKKLLKTSKLAINLFVTLARVLNVPIESKGNKYYSKVFERVYKKL